MRSRIMLGTALLGAMTVVGVFANESDAAYRGVARPAAAFRGYARPAMNRPTAFRAPVGNFRPPMANSRRPMPSFGPRVLTTRDFRRGPEIARGEFRRPAVHPPEATVRRAGEWGREGIAASHRLPEHRPELRDGHIPGVYARERVEPNRPELREGHIPGVYARERPEANRPDMREGRIPGVSRNERPDMNRESRRDRDDHFRDWSRTWDRDFRHWGDRDFRNQFSDSFGRLGEHGLRYLDGFRHGNDFGFRHLGNHVWHSVWDHGFRPFGDLAGRYMDDHGFRPWWPASTRRVVSSRHYFGVLGAVPLGGGDSTQLDDGQGDNGQ